MRRWPRDPLDRLLRTFLALRNVPLAGDATPEMPENLAALLPRLRSHRLRPLAHWVARELRANPPDSIRTELESAFYATTLRYDQLRSSLAQLGAAFVTAGIPVIALKGLVLADHFYPHPACRPMEDIDLLVRKEDLEIASHTVVSLGYSDKSFGVEDFRNPDTGIVVDLHTELLNTTRLPSRRKAWSPDLCLWRNRARPLPSYPGILFLDPQDHLVYLCHHAWLHHGLQRPLAFVDICLLLSEANQREAKKTWPQPAGMGSETRGLWYAFLSCQHRLGVVLPEGCGRVSRPADARLFENLVHGLAIRGWLPERARYGYLALAIPPGNRMQFLWQLLSARRNRAKARSCAEECRQVPNSQANT
jgi:hypothetical protein